jgi:tetratricopeptide (TPR) repeat protein
MQRALGIAAIAGLSWIAGACAGSQHGTTTPGREVVEMEELRITAARGAQGYRFDVYDAADLFTRATELLNQQKCREAVELYDRLVREFAQSRYASASLYNAGLCLQALADFEASAQRYGALRSSYPESDDRKDASFQLAEVLVQLERWPDVMTVADELLARDELSSDERLEAMARRAQALLGQQQFEEAERYARSALSFYRTRPAEAPIKDDFFAAACNYVLAETYRQREQKMAFPEGLEPQKQVLLRRAELLLEAQREYFNTISLNNLDNYHWAAASGYRIGSMYDELWQAIMSAPVPAHLPPEGHAIYRDELAKLVKPLIRHAIRYWELTEMFIERTAIQTPWADKIKSDLARVRVLLLEQPAGPGGLPAPAAAPSSAAPPKAEPPKQRARSKQPKPDADGKLQ